MSRDTSSLIPPDTDQEVNGCESFLTGFLLPPDSGQEMNRCMTFMGSWFVICGTVCDEG